MHHEYNPEFLRAAIRLSIEKVPENQGGPFGAVVVRDGSIVSTGWNQVTFSNDPTAHAEIIAIRTACARLETFSLTGCDIYCNCEPCPMCLAACYWSRLDRIYYAATRDDAALAGFDDREIYREFARSPAERAIPMHQALHDEAVVAFTAWSTKEDQTAY